MYLLEIIIQRVTATLLSATSQILRYDWQNTEQIEPLIGEKMGKTLAMQRPCDRNANRCLFGAKSYYLTIYYAIALRGPRNPRLDAPG
jgi:hypothetical protein